MVLDNNTTEDSHSRVSTKPKRWVTDMSQMEGRGKLSMVSAVGCHHLSAQPVLAFPVLLH